MQYGISALNFSEQFANEEQCLAFLADLKWQDGFVCKHCGNTNYCKGKRPYSRRCTKCKKEESATAHTVFHNCRIDIKKAFELTYKVCTQPDISTYKLSEELKIRQMTCWRLKNRMIECLKNKDMSEKQKFIAMMKPL